MHINLIFVSKVFFLFFGSSKTLK